jgi:hypothetical protein
MKFVYEIDRARRARPWISDINLGISSQANRGRKYSNFHCFWQSLVLFGGKERGLLEKVKSGIDRTRRVLLGTGLEHLQHLQKWIWKGFTRIWCYLHLRVGIANIVVSYFELQLLNSWIVELNFQVLRIWNFFCQRFFSKKYSKWPSPSHSVFIWYWYGQITTIISFLFY